MHQSQFLVGFFCVALFLMPNSASAASPNAPHDSSKWEKDIAAFEKADREKPVKAGGALFIGSSSIRMWKSLVADFPDHSVLNRGFGGSQIADSLNFADRIILPYKPSVIFLYAGDNDVNAGKSPEVVLADFEALVKKVHASLPETRIGFIAIKPSLKRWGLIDQVAHANYLVEGFCRETPHAFYVDIYHPMLLPDGTPDPKLFIKDGLHMTEKGYAIWKEAILPYLNAYGKVPEGQ